MITTNDMQAKTEQLRARIAKAILHSMDGKAEIARDIAFYITDRHHNLQDMLQSKHAT